MPREENGWGNCVRCGEMLTPDDAEELGWSDRCRFCLEVVDVFDIVNPRLQYIKNQLKLVSSEDWKEKHGVTGQEHWQKRLDSYQKIRDTLIEVLKIKTSEDWDMSYPSSCNPIRRSR